MQIGPYKISTVNFGAFRLDGGAMFGSVPKNLWSKRIAPDDQNRIQLGLRCLLLESPGQVILVDCGIGNKWSEKEKSIYAIEERHNEVVETIRSRVTHLILTHLHFDHAGGVTERIGGNLQLTFPAAEIILQKENYENALNPNLRERASYLGENVELLKDSKLRLVSGTTEVFAGVWVHQVNGHSRGQQIVEVRGDKSRLYYPTDLIPTAHHLPIPFTMGYDMCTETVLREKAELLALVEQNNAVVVFEHDSEVAACTVTKDQKGHYCVDKVLATPAV